MQVVLIVVLLLFCFISYFYACIVVSPDQGPMTPCQVV
jgi:hypothetical protein